MPDIQVRTDGEGRTTYCARIRVKGERPRVATFNTMTAAKQWAQRTEGDIRRGLHLPDVEAKRRTLADAIDRYEASPGHLAKRPGTLASQAKHLAWWKAELGHRTLHGLTPALIGDARDRLAAGEDRKTPKRRRPRKLSEAPEGAPEAPLAKPRTPATVCRYLACLSAVLSFAVKELGWIQDNPMRRVSKPKEPGGRCRVLAEEERAALLEACRNVSPDLADLVTLALCTAARKGELRGLTWGDVDLSRRVITLRDTKNGGTRVVPVRGEAEAVLAARAKFRRLDNPHVFPAPFRRGKAPGGPMDFTGPWYRALAEAGLEDFKFHDLRHTAASYLAMSGASLPELAAILGHKQLSMVQRYAHFCEGHGGDVLERMTAKLFAAEGGRP